LRDRKTLLFAAAVFAAAVAAPCAVRAADDHVINIQSLKSELSRMERQALGLAVIAAPRFPHAGFQ